MSENLTAPGEKLLGWGGGGAPVAFGLVSAISGWF